MFWCCNPRFFSWPLQFPPNSLYIFLNGKNHLQRSFSSVNTDIFTSYLNLKVLTSCKLSETATPTPFFFFKKSTSQKDPWVHCPPHSCGAYCLHSHYHSSSWSLQNPMPFPLLLITLRLWLLSGTSWGLVQMEHALRGLRHQWSTLKWNTDFCILC